MYFRNRQLLLEGAETKNMKAAKHYLYQHMGMDEQQAMKTIGAIKTDIPNSRLGKCKFMLAMVRMLANGDFDEGQKIMKVNQCLKYAASNAHINEYDQDLNGLSYEQFTQKFATSVQQDLEQDKEDVNSQTYNDTQSNYNIVKIRSFEEAEEYGNYVDWCVTHDEDMFDSYTSNGNGVFYFCLRDGFENVPETPGEDCPLDEYGLSMIAVSINNDGTCNTITCRWNHERGGNDNIMTPKQLSQIINRNFYQVFKPLTAEEIKAKEAERFYTIAEEVKECYEYYNTPDEFCDTFYCDESEGNKDERTVYSFRSDKGCVLLDAEGQFISNEVFTYIGQRRGDLLMVVKGNKTNFITLDGKLISDVWFDRANNYFDVGYSGILLNNKCNIIDKSGKPVLKQWYNGISNDTFDRFKGCGIARVFDNSAPTKNDFVSLITGEPIFKAKMKTFCYFEDESVRFLNKQTRTYGIIKFEGMDYSQIFDLRTGQIVAPYKIETVNGSADYGHMPCVILYGDKSRTTYVVLPNCDLAIKHEQTGRYVTVQKNPLSQQTNESFGGNLNNTLTERIYKNICGIISKKYTEK